MFICKCLVKVIKRGMGFWGGGYLEAFEIAKAIWLLAIGFKEGQGCVV